MFHIKEAKILYASSLGVKVQLLNTSSSLKVEVEDVMYCNSISYNMLISKSNHGLFYVPKLYFCCKWCIIYMTRDSSKYVFVQLV